MRVNTMNRRMRRRAHSERARARGFTLVELLLVLIILALIGGLVLPNIIGRAEGAKVKAAASLGPLATCVCVDCPVPRQT